MSVRSYIGSTGKLCFKFKTKLSDTVYLLKMFMKYWSGALQKVTTTLDCLRTILYFSKGLNQLTHNLTVAFRSPLFVLQYVVSNLLKYTNNTQLQNVVKIHASVPCQQLLLRRAIITESSRQVDGSISAWLGSQKSLALWLDHIVGTV